MFVKTRRFRGNQNAKKKKSNGPKTDLLANQAVENLKFQITGWGNLNVLGAS